MGAQVIIVGGGPTGIMAANILGEYGVETIVFDKLKGVFPFPRAAVIDDDIVRITQFCGLEEKIQAVSTVSKGYQFLDQENEPMFGFKRTGANTLNGYPTSLLIRQPEVEEVLREGLENYDNVTLYTKHEVVGINEEEDRITLTVKDLDTKEEKTFATKYVIAADGAKSFVREAVGIKRKDLNFQHPWLVVDIKASEGVKFQNLNKQFCHPNRPATYLYLGNDMYRWEIALLEDEKSTTYKSPEAIKGLLSHWIDPDGIEVDRHIVYVFQSLIATKMRKGRIFLAGDSAHQMPPFLGQGLSSGLRDAINISWKIAYVLNHGVDEAIFNTYESERLPHVEKIMHQAVQLGEIIQLDDKKMADFRDRLFRYLNSIPNVNHALHNLERSTSPIGTGLHHPSLDANDQTLFPQPVVRLHDGTEEKLDTVIGARFAIIASPTVSEHDLEMWKRAIADHSLTNMMTSLQLVDEKPIKEGQFSEVTAWVKDWFSQHGAEAVIVRPDRYVYAKGNVANMPAIIADLKGTLG